LDIARSNDHRWLLWTEGAKSHFLAWNSIFFVPFVRTIYSRSVESFAEFRNWRGNGGNLVKHFHYSYILREAKYRLNSPKNCRSLTKGLQSNWKGHIVLSVCPCHHRSRTN